MNYHKTRGHGMPRGYSKSQQTGNKQRHGHTYPYAPDDQPGTYAYSHEYLPSTQWGMSPNEPMTSPNHQFSNNLSYAWANERLYSNNIRETSTPRSDYSYGNRGQECTDGMHTVYDANEFWQNDYLSDSNFNHGNDLEEKKSREMYKNRMDETQKELSPFIETDFKNSILKSLNESINYSFATRWIKSEKEDPQSCGTSEINQGYEIAPPQAQKQPTSKGSKRLLKGLAQPVASSNAERIMKMMGWQGGSLGANMDGIAEPIVPNLFMVSDPTAGDQNNVQETAIPPIELTVQLPVGQGQAIGCFPKVLTVPDVNGAPHAVYLPESSQVPNPLSGVGHNHRSGTFDPATGHPMSAVQISQCAVAVVNPLGVNGCAIPPTSVEHINVTNLIPQCTQRSRKRILAGDQQSAVANSTVTHEVDKTVSEPKKIMSNSSLNILYKTNTPGLCIGPALSKKQRQKLRKTAMANELSATSVVNAITTVPRNTMSTAKTGSLTFEPESISSGAYHSIFSDHTHFMIDLSVWKDEQSLRNMLKQVGLKRGLRKILQYQIKLLGKNARAKKRQSLTVTSVVNPATTVVQQTLKLPEQGTLTAQTIPVSTAAIHNTIVSNPKKTTINPTVSNDKTQPNSVWADANAGALTVPAGLSKSQRSVKRKLKKMRKIARTKERLAATIAVVNPVTTMVQETFSVAQTSPVSTVATQIVADPKNTTTHPNVFVKNPIPKPLHKITKKHAVRSNARDWSKYLHQYKLVYTTSKVVMPGETAETSAGAELQFTSLDMGIPPQIDLTNSASSQRKDTKVAIVASNGVPITAERGELILNQLLEFIINPGYTVPEPINFEGQPSYEGGGVHLWCANAGTLEWLKLSVARLSSDIGPLEVRLLSELRQVRCAITLPGKWAHRADSMACLLDRQNPWAEVHRWWLHGVSARGDNTFVEFGVPESEAVKIAEQGREIAFGVGSQFMQFKGADGSYGPRFPQLSGDANPALLEPDADFTELML